MRTSRDASPPELTQRWQFVAVVNDVAPFRLEGEFGGGGEEGGGTREAGGEPAAVGVRSPPPSTSPPGAARPHPPQPSGA